MVPAPWRSRPRSGRSIPRVNCGLGMRGLSLPDAVEPPVVRSSVRTLPTPAFDVSSKPDAVRPPYGAPGVACALSLSDCNPWAMADYFTNPEHARDLGETLVASFGRDAGSSWRMWPIERLTKLSKRN